MNIHSEPSDQICISQLITRRTGKTCLKKMTAQKVKREHFLVVKKSGFAADGMVLSARASTEKLLDAGFWPLWKNTRCKHMIESGNRLLFYIAGAEPGCRSVIARAVVESVDNWTDKAFKRNYPLMLDGEPDKVIRLSSIFHLGTPVDLLTVLDRLSFIPKNKNKWGVAMMGGVRSLTAGDYEVLKGLD